MQRGERSGSLAAGNSAARTQGCFTLGADVGEERFGGLVGRVLRDEVAEEGALEDGAAEGDGAATGALDRGAERVECRELLLDPGDDPKRESVAQFGTHDGFFGQSRSNPRG